MHARIQNTAEKICSSRRFGACLHHTSDLISVQGAFLQPPPPEEGAALWTRFKVCLGHASGLFLVQGASMSLTAGEEGPALQRFKACLSHAWWPSFIPGSFANRGGGFLHTIQTLGEFDILVLGGWGLPSVAQAGLGLAGFRPAWTMQGGLLSVWEALLTEGVATLLKGALGLSGWYLVIHF